MIYEVVVVADENDGDYVTRVSTLKQNQLPMLVELSQRIKNNHSVWQTGEIGDPYKDYPDWTEEEIGFMEGLVPWGQYGVHTIESIEYYPIPEKVKLI